MAASPGGIEVARLSVRVLPDTSNLYKDLKVELDKIEKQLKLKIKVEADTTGFELPLATERKRQEKDPIKIPVKAATDEFAASIKAKAEAISKTAQINLPVTAKGEQLRRDIATQVASINALVKIKIPVDLAEATALRVKLAAELASLQAMADSAGVKVPVTTKAANLGVKILDSSFVHIIGTVAILGAAFIPLIATLGAVTAAFVAPLAVAGGGLTLFAFLAGAVIKQTDKQKKAIDQLAKSVQTAKAALAATKASAAAGAAASLASAQGATNASLKSAQASAQATLTSARQAFAQAKTVSQKVSALQRIKAAETALATRKAAIGATQSNRLAAIGATQSKAVAAAQKKVTDAQSAYKKALDQLTPAQKKFLDAQAGFKTAFQKLIVTLGPAILGPVTQAINLVTTLLPTIKPVIDAVSGFLTGLLKKFGNLAKDPGYKSFIDSFAKHLGPDLKLVSRIAGNLFIGLYNIFGTLDTRLGNTLLKGIGNLTDKFANFGKSQSFKNFIKYLKDVLPTVGDTLKSVGKAFGKIVTALLPLGKPTLNVIKGIADAFSSIPIKVLTTLAATAAALTVFSKVGGFKVLGALGKVGKGGGLIKSITGGGGIQKVFVTNPGFGGGGEVKAGASLASKVLGVAVGAGVIAAAFKIGTAYGNKEDAKNQKRFGTTNLVDVAKAKLSEAQLKGFKGTFDSTLKIDESPASKARLAFLEKLQKEGFDVHVNLPKKGSNKIDLSQLKFDYGLTADQARKALEPAIKSASTHVDALKANLAKASTAIDQIGPHAKNSFGAATQAVRDLQNELKRIHDKQVKILVQKLDAVKSLEALQAFRLKDKVLTVNVIERAVGPGGGIGQPSKNNPTKVPPPKVPGRSTSTSATGGGPLVNVEKMYANDTNDILRKSDRRRRARGGGGVLFTPGPSPVGAFS